MKISYSFTLSLSVCCFTSTFIIPSQVGLQQYRDSKTPTHTCSSPTSPVANPEYSPVPSPVPPIGSPGSVSPVQTQFNNSKAGNFYQQQAQNLPHQFEQISMLQESAGSPPSISQQVRSPIS